jgi:hypothetical protein
MQKLLKQGHVAPRLQSSLQKNLRSQSQSGWPLRTIYMCISQMTIDLYFIHRCFVSSMALPRLLPHLTVYTSNTTGVPSEAGTPYLLQSSPCFLVGSVLLIFVCLWCPIMCLYILSSVLWCPHKTDVLFVFTSSCLSEDSCLIYIICVFWGIDVSNTYYIVFFGV